MYRVLSEMRIHCEVKHTSAGQDYLLVSSFEALSITHLEMK